MALKDMLSDEDRAELEIRNLHRWEIYWVDVIRQMGLVMQRLRLAKGWSINDLADASGANAKHLQQFEYGNWLNEYMLASAVGPAAKELGTTVQEIVEACEADLNTLRRFLNDRHQHVRSTRGVI